MSGNWVIKEKSHKLLTLSAVALAMRVAGVISLIFSGFRCCCSNSTILIQNQISLVTTTYKKLKLEILTENVGNSDATILSQI